MVDAVTGHGPVDNKRHAELTELFAGARVGIIYVSRLSQSRRDSPVSQRYRMADCCVDIGGTVTPDPLRRWSTPWSLLDRSALLFGRAGIVRLDVPALVGLDTAKERADAAAGWLHSRGGSTQVHDPSNAVTHPTRNVHTVVNYHHRSAPRIFQRLPKAHRIRLRQSLDRESIGRQILRYASNSLCLNCNDLTKLLNTDSAPAQNRQNVRCQAPNIARKLIVRPHLPQV